MKALSLTALLWLGLASCYQKNVSQWEVPVIHKGGCEARAATLDQGPCTPSEIRWICRDGEDFVITQQLNERGRCSVRRRPLAGC